ncbi:MAG: hypothetical protein J7M18_03995 [Candidatus Eremiobacteraeota bacterium]|nr:hypothetical protein [Candidatus Eremiobacteraeota bacterium]
MEMVKPCQPEPSEKLKLIAGKRSGVGAWGRNIPYNKHMAGINKGGA